jgi:hypothetical protein
MPVSGSCILVNPYSPRRRNPDPARDIGFGREPFGGDICMFNFTAKGPHPHTPTSCERGRKKNENSGLSRNDSSRCWCVVLVVSLGELSSCKEQEHRTSLGPNPRARLKHDPPNLRMNQLKPQCGLSGSAPARSFMGDLDPVSALLLRYKYK